MRPAPGEATTVVAWIAAAAQSWKGQHKSARFGLEEASRIGRAWTRRLVSCIPELLLSRSIAGKKSELMSSWNLDNGSCPVHVTGVVSCHALGAMGDTIDLLADLGRAARIATGLGKQRNFAVMLAGQEWSGYNRIARDYGIANFDEFEDWRLNLYTSIGCQVRLCNLEYEPDGRRKVKELARKYVELARALFGSDKIGRPMSTAEAAAIKPEGVPAAGALLKIGLVAERIRADWQVIEKVVEYLNRLDADTFTYYLTQRFQQYAFHDYLKVAVRSERNFDPPFLELDRHTERRGVERAIYFKEYILRGELDRPAFVIPYYFPSGSLYRGRQVPLQEYRDSVILLDRLDDEAHALHVFKAMPYPSNARLLGDVLSFVHAWLFPLTEGRVTRPDGKVENTTRRDRSAEAPYLSSQFEAADPDFGESWRLYATQQGVFEPLLLQWSDNLFSGFVESMPLPYFYFPFWWLRAGNAEGAAAADTVFVAAIKMLARTLDAPASPRED